MNIEKELRILWNTLMSDSVKGKRIVLDSFATRYLVLMKKQQVNSEEYKLFDSFFKALNLIPNIDINGNISYKKVKEKEEIKEKQQFFKKKNIVINNVDEKKKESNVDNVSKIFDSPLIKSILNELNLDSDTMYFIIR